MKKLLQSLFILLFVATTAMAQERTITGTVSSVEDGLPLPGVGVKVKGGSTGVSTDASGRFSIKVNNGATLVFSSVGFAATEIAVGSRNSINVKLTSEAKSLDEVVIQVPYGTVKKSAFTGAESTVGSASLEKTQMTSISRALEGRVSGVVATNGGGQPGSDATFRVRGIGSVNASSAPLYVLDGAVYNGNIASLSSDDVESITVLKDAAATALYGARAANGVIMIQTKRGRRGEAQITANVRTGWMNRGIPQYDLVDQKDYYETMWEATRNRFQYASGQTATVAGQSATNQLISGALIYNAYNVPNNQLVDPVTGKLNPNASLLWNDDWNKELFNPDALRQDYNVNISGANDKTDYFFSGGYISEEGVAKFTNYSRYTTRMNVNTQARPWLKAGVSLDAAVASQRNSINGGTATSNPFYYSTMMGPIYPVYQRNTTTGAYVVDPTTGKNALDWGIASQMGIRPYATQSNLLGTLDLDDRSSRPININSNTYVEISFLKDFKFRPSISATLWDNNATTFQNSLFGDAANVAGRSTKSNNRQFTYTFNQVLSYSKKINDHEFSALLGHESFAYKQNFVSATRTGFPFPGTSELTSAAIGEASDSYQNDHRIESYFSKADYNYKSRYYLSASLRRDATSRFSGRADNFYSVSGAWRASQETFLKGVSWISDLKLRASYGQLGNEAYGSNYYAGIALYGLGWNNVAAPGAIVSALANPILEWEKNTTANIGIDFSLFKNRLQGSVELYDKQSKNLLFDVPLPISTGIPTRLENIGTLSNKGIDFTVAYRAIQGNKFDWTVDLNLTTFKNEFKELPQREIIDGTKKYMVGRSIYDFWIKEYMGVDPATGLALFKQDVLGTDGLPTGATTTTTNFTNGSFYYHGSAIPDFTGGITNSFRYGDFDLSFLFTFQVGGDFYDSNYASLMHVGSYGTAWHKDILNRWTPSNTNTNVPRVQNALANQAGISTRYIFDASYLNLKNVTFGYNIPKSMSNKIGVKSSRFFANLDNAYLWHKGPKGMNPQGSFNGITDFIYPVYRTFTVGLSINL